MEGGTGGRRLWQPGDHQQYTKSCGNCAEDYPNDVARPNHGESELRDACGDI